MDPKVINMSNGKLTISPKRAFVIGAIILAAIFVLSWANPVVIIPAGNRGITLRLGAVQDAVRAEGLSFKVPFIDTIVKFNVRTQKVALNKQNAVSNDLQDVFVDAVVTYHPSPNNVAKIYREIGTDFEDKKIIPLTINTIKTHTAKYKVSDILQNREKITSDVTSDLRDQLAKNNIALEDVSLTNIDFRPEYKDAIEKKQIAEKEVETQQFKLDKQALEAQQVVKQAEAQKQAKILEGEGIKSYNEAIRQSLSPDVAKFKELENQEKAINKWDGKYPSTVVGGDTVPLIQIGDNKGNNN